MPGVTVSEVHGFGRSRAVGVPGAVTEENVGYVKKSKLEIVVPDELLDPVLQLITQHAHTGNPGDGKIFVYPVQEIIRIRTGERGLAAI